MALDKAASLGRSIAEKGVEAGADKVALATVSTGTLVGGVGIAAALAAGISQMEYENKKQDMKDLYKEEIAAQLGKSENKVKAKDIDVLAKGNRTVAEHLGKAKKVRNLNIATTFAAILLSVTVVAALASSAAGAGIFAAIATIGTPAVGGVLAFIAKSAIAMGLYNIAKKPLQSLGHKLFNTDVQTSHDRIESIQRDHEEGKTISRERVFSVLVHANPELDAFIQTKYGKKFDALSVPDKIALTDAIGDHLNVKRIADDINHSRIKATELAFTADGTISGVLKSVGEEPKHTVLNTIKQKLYHTAETLTGHAPEPVVQEPVALTERGHTRRRMTHVEQLAQQRANSALAQQRG